MFLYRRQGLALILILRTVRLNKEIYIKTVSIFSGVLLLHMNRQAAVKRPVTAVVTIIGTL